MQFCTNKYFLDPSTLTIPNVAHAFLKWQLFGTIKPAESNSVLDLES